MKPEPKSRGEAPRRETRRDGPAPPSETSSGTASGAPSDPPSDPLPDPLPDAPPGTDRFAEAAGRAAETREALLAHRPAPHESLRTFGAAETARWLIPSPDPAELRRRLTAAHPRGLALPALVEERRRAGLTAERPEGAAAKILAVANFKGGVGKTTVAAHLAQAAALDGLRVLLVDLDSQGSLSALMGGRAEDAWGTAWPILARDHALALEAAGLPLDDEGLLRARAKPPVQAIAATRWPAIDLIPAQLDLYWAEFQIPVWRMALPDWALWDALSAGLAEALAAKAEAGDAYDLVIVDTPPALGYLTLNALAAADLLLAPLGASFLDFDSTGRFFDMLHAAFASIEAAEPGLRFEWDAARCLITRYDPAQQAEMAALIDRGFGDLMARCRLDQTAAAGQAGEQGRALYEADPRDFNPATYARGRAAFDAVWAEMRALVEAAWARDLAQAQEV